MANLEKIKELVDSARRGVTTSRLIIDAIKKSASEGNLEAQKVLEQMRQYVRGMACSS